MTSVKWIKLSVNMFDDEKIKVIESMPEGDSLLLIWVKLLTLAGKANLDGYIYISENIPYTEAILSSVMNKPITIIHLALETFKSFGMIEEDENGFYLVNYDKYQSVTRLQEIREYNRLAQQRHREKIKNQRLSMTLVNDKSMTSQKCHALDIDKDIDIYKEEIYKEESLTNNDIFDFYENNIGSLSSNQMQKLVRFREQLSDEIIKYAIEKACDRNAKNFSYIKAILENWINEGYKTLGDIQSKQQNNKKSAPVPYWIDKEIQSEKKEDLSEEDKREFGID